jgi:isoleucyl-tRNA synthetase
VEQFLLSKAGEPERFDRWILSRYNLLIKDVSECLDKYEITKPVRAIQQFVIDDLSNWYVRLNRRRFWAKADDPSKMRAYHTLYTILDGVAKLSAPVAPFTSELFWKELHGDNREKHGEPLSVHMTQYPKPDEKLIDSRLDEVMDTVRRIVSLGRAARSRKNLKVRQPLSRLLVSLKQEKEFDRLKEYLEIVEDELNVKEVVPAANLDQYVRYAAKLNFKVAGPKLGSHVKAAQAFIAGLSGEAVREFASSGKLTFEADGTKVVLTSEEVDVQRIENEGFAVENDGPVTIALVTDLTPELIDEGFARELVNKIQNMRKSSGFDVTDHIEIRMSGTGVVKAAAGKHEEFIRRETLAHRIEFIEDGSLPDGTEWNINGEKAALAVKKL